MREKGCYVFIICVVLCMMSSCTDCLDDSTENKITDYSDIWLKNYNIKINGISYTPIDTCGTSWMIIVPAGTNLSKIVATYDCNAKQILVNEMPQKSGVSENDFSNIQEGVKYVLLSAGGGKKIYNIRIIDTDLPVLIINTEKRIDDKINWINGFAFLYDNNNVELFDSVQLKGRGNYTWIEYPKKPYAIKLKTKSRLLGMPDHKRWCLLALWRGAIGNDLMFECSRKAEAIEYTPRGKYVEVILNKSFIGLYYLCEQIKVDKARVNIKKIEPSDLHYPEISGGYLLEYDTNYDEEYKFITKHFQMPVNLKSPNDAVPPQQIDYIYEYIEKMEEEFLKIGTNKNSYYHEYIDINNWIDYLLVLGIVGNYEAFSPRSMFMYKDRDKNGIVSKMKMGPLWDQEIIRINVNWSWLRNLEGNYFRYLHKDRQFCVKMKERFSLLRSKLEGITSNESILDYLLRLEKNIGYSARRDISIWGNDTYNFDDEVLDVQRDFYNRLNYMEETIDSLLQTFKIESTTQYN